MKIQKNTLLIASFVLAGMISCNADTSNKDEIIVENPVSAPVEATTPISAEAVIAPAPAPTQALALNPPHGQPGHDCAVEVGAPLNGSAAAPTPAPATITTAPLPNALGGPIPKFNASSNLNPAHGQPGHDCAVAVGAPLPSK